MIFTSHRDGSRREPEVKIVPAAVWWRLTILAACLCASAASLSADTPKPPANDDCLACHGEPSATRADGRPVAVDPGSFSTSVHGSLGMACIDCHTDLARTTEFPHPDHLARVNCATCHENPAAQYATSVHGHVPAS